MRRVRAACQHDQIRAGFPGHFYDHVFCRIGAEGDLLPCMATVNPPHQLPETLPRIHLKEGGLVDIWGGIGSFGASTDKCSMTCDTVSCVETGEPARRRAGRRLPSWGNRSVANSI